MFISGRNRQFSVGVGWPGIGARVFHQIEFSTFPNWETYKNQYVGLKFDVEFEFEKKMTTVFSGKKVSPDSIFEIFKFRVFSKKIQIEILAKSRIFLFVIFAVRLREYLSV